MSVNRKELVAAAAGLWDASQMLPEIDASEYLRGQCELIAQATDMPPYGAKWTVRKEIQQALTDKAEAEKLIAEWRADVASGATMESFEEWNTERLLAEEGRI